MKPDITIGIPTCARPEKIKACLDSIRRHVTLDHKLIIVDSRITDETKALYAGLPNMRLFGYQTPISPAAARQLIAKNVDTPYLLFLDDDNEVTPGAVEAMYEYLERDKAIDIVGCGWREYGVYRPLGQRFNFGTIGDRRVVYKTYVTIEELRGLGLTSVRVDVVLATMLVRRGVFDQVQFDPQFSFYFDLFDFFLQCYEKRLSVSALAGVIFEHKPTSYRTHTQRHDSKKDVDQRRLLKKWGLHQIGGTRGYKPSMRQRIREGTRSLAERLRGG